MTSPPSTRPRCTPALGIGIGVALGMIAIELVPTGRLVQFFSHPVLFRELEEIPLNTFRGVNLLRLTLVLAAMAWVIVPWLIGRMGRPDPLGTPQPASRSEWILLGIIGLGVLLRVLRIQESLWFDEITALTNFSIYGPGPALGNYYALSNHVLHSALVSVATNVAGGADELIIRTPAFLFGIAGIPLAYLLGREVGGARMGIFTALAIALMPVSILESVEARAYSMMIFFSLGSSWLFIRMDNRNNAIDALGYAILVALGVWSHLVFVCVPIGHGLFAVWNLLRKDHRPAGLRQTLALVLGGCTTLVLLSPVLPDLLQLRDRFGAGDGNEPTLFGPEGFHALLGLGGAWIWWAALPGLALGLIGIQRSIDDPRLRRGLLITVLGGLVAVVLTLVADSWLYARFLVFTLSFSALAIAAALDRLASTSKGRVIAGIMSMVLVGGWMADLGTRTPKQPIREGVATVANLITGPDRRVLSLGLADDVATYYAQPAEITLIKTGNLGAELPDLETAPNLALVLYPDRLSAEIRSHLDDAGFQEVSRHAGWLDWGHGDVVILQR